MPKFGAHIIISEVAAARRPDLIAGPTNASRLGAIGPDLTLFLFDPISKNPDVRKGFDVATSVLKGIRDFQKELERIKNIFEVEKDVADWITGGLSTDLASLAESSLDIMKLVIKLGLAIGMSGLNIKNPIFTMIAGGQFNPALLSDPKYASPDFLIEASDNFGFPFRFFGHPYTNDPPWHNPEAQGDYKNWWWMDMLHYRKTGQFANALAHKARADSNSTMEAYATGYLSHVCGDICGHPFINSLVHGPFRNHAYRHIVLESLADTWLWDKEKKADILESNLHNQIDLSPGELNAVCRQFEWALKATYMDPEVPSMLPNGYPTITDLRGAYERMHLYLDLSTGGKVTRPNRPPENAGDALDELQELLSKYTPSAPPTWNPSRPLESILAVLGFLLRGIVYIAMLATLPAAYLIRLATIPGRWLLYLIHLGLYLIVSGLRTLLSLMGWGYASNDDFKNFGFLDELITVDKAQISEAYPMMSTFRPKPPFYWLIPPRYSAKIELPRTSVGPIHFDIKPDWMISKLNSMDTRLALDRLIYANSPSDTRLAMNGLINGFGNAPDFMIAVLNNDIALENFDLDGDRGYGYKTWEYDPQKGIPGSERYL